MESYIEDKKNLYSSIHEFLEESDDEVSKESFTKLIKVINTQQIEKDEEEMRQFLEIIKSIGENHHRDQHFNEKINQLLFQYKDQIKQTLSNLELYHIFENNKKIVLFLLKKDIITISDEIYKEMVNKLENNGNSYWHFFIPELENFVGEEKVTFVKNELLKEDPAFFTNFEDKREEGENESHICSLIRKDSVEDFISYVNQQNISPSSKISPSIFETNPFLIDNKNTTLIEYSAFFGSIQIFRYLLMNKAELTPSLWLYAIHSKNAEMIHLLESSQVPPPTFNNIEEEEENDVNEIENSDKNYILCLIESIKCNHNDIADYIENNLLDSKLNLQQNEEILSSIFKYHNYSLFQIDSIIKSGFFYLCFYHYEKLFELLLKKNEQSIEEKLIQYPDIQSAVENNETEVIYHYLLEMKEIPKGIFSGTKIKQVSIPSSITSIGENAFDECQSLVQVSIPSSVKSIGEAAFSGCFSLKQIEIPSSVASIGKHAFSYCFSLTHIEIPSSVTSIESYAFYKCSSLELVSISSTSITSIERNSFCTCPSLIQITIPSSVRLIGECALSDCSSLAKITIPSSVTSILSSGFAGCRSLTQVQFEIPSSLKSIGYSSFPECSSLTDFIIPSSVRLIDSFALSGCSSLKQITIPSSVTSIGQYAFNKCSSLAQVIFETSSVTSIGNFAFAGCSKLTEIDIPSSVTSFGYSVFLDCSSLIQFMIPSSVTSIEKNTFSGCSSLKQITIPSSVTSIEEYAFSKCSSLAQITIPSSVISIGRGVFFRCSSLTQIAIPSSVTSIGKSAFSKCSSLAQITIPSSIDTKNIGLRSNIIINTI